MEKGIEIVARLLQAGKRSYARKGAFLGVFAFTFVASVGMLGRLDLLPAPPTPGVVTAASAEPSAAVPALAQVVELPTDIVIPAIGLAAAVVNPTTTNVEVLDHDLLLGAVRYPTSALLGEEGNVVLFGHSSYLPIVGNQAYKTFNGIQKLKVGDTVIVSSSGTAYTYRVRSVTKESADNASIPLSVTGRVLTLSTCDSFGAKSDRFVVVADFVESHTVSTS